MCCKVQLNKLSHILSLSRCGASALLVFWGVRTVQAPGSRSGLARSGCSSLPVKGPRADASIYVPTDGKVCRSQRLQTARTTVLEVSHHEPTPLWSGHPNVALRYTLQGLGFVRSQRFAQRKGSARNSGRHNSDVILWHVEGSTRPSATCFLTVLTQAPALAQQTPSQQLFVQGVL